VLALSVAAVDGFHRLRHLANDMPVAGGVAAPVPTAANAAVAVPLTPAAPPKTFPAGKKKRVTEPGALLKPLTAQSKDKEQLIKWLRANSPDLIGAELKKIHLFLNGQLLFTFEDLTKLGPEGVASLSVSPKIKSKFKDLLIAHIGQTRGVEDGLMVTVPLYTKPVFVKDDCKDENAARFAQVAPETSVGDWLSRMFPDTPKLQMTRAILDIKRQTIESFSDLHRVGLAGVAKLLYVPAGMREKLREAIIWHIGVTGGHDDQQMVTYNEMKKPDDGLVPAIEVKPKKTKCQAERERKGEA